MCNCSCLSNCSLVVDHETQRHKRQSSQFRNLNGPFLCEMLCRKQGETWQGIITFHWFQTDIQFCLERMRVMSAQPNITLSSVCLGGCVLLFPVRGLSFKFALNLKLWVRQETLRKQTAFTAWRNRLLFIETVYLKQQYEHLFFLKIFLNT